MRYSDDGEPGGTAGMPIIEVMKARGVTDVYKRQTLGRRLEPLVTAQAIESGRDADAALLRQNPDFHQHERCV